MKVIVSSNSGCLLLLYFPKSWTLKLFHGSCWMNLWRWKYNSHMAGCGAPERSSGPQGFGECVHGAGSRGGALTLVSFTKGVSPPPRPTRHTWSLKPWGSPSKAALPPFPDTCGKIKKRKMASHLSLQLPPSHPHIVLWEACGCVT